MYKPQPATAVPQHPLLLGWCDAQWTATGRGKGAELTVGTVADRGGRWSHEGEYVVPRELHQAGVEGQGC